MARKKSQLTELVEDIQLNPDLATTTKLMAEVSSQFSEERDFINQLLGQVQMARSFAKFADVVSLSKLKYIKENKIYHALKGKKGVDLDGKEIADVGTWDGFCQALGLSRGKVDEDLSNLTAFGEDALKHLSAVGAGYRELRQFRRLPEDQKSALIEVAKEGDKTALLELAEEMIARHIKEKEELKTDLEISRQALAEKNSAFHRVIDENSELRDKITRVKYQPADEKISRIKQEINADQSITIVTLLRMKNEFSELIKSSDNVSLGYISGVLEDIQTHIEIIRQELDLPNYREHNPASEWINGNVDDNIIN
ncbi:hypothetical protein [Pectobacterium sp. IFB5596]|uniref:hypothetical protein n=1 Tax=Pectobacterium sp. IFB5596 TaxID=1839803 RepID=UPI001F2F01A5|nr:hypothetical protein [Pectobacterium sp. IFB5596]MCE9733919.1 hypothetical protein [Pectobacterium sp. IFB5596]GKW13521.1 hypothetical protein PEC301899_38030 [Pectobacterium carotovorum subsp. carotovorum]